MTEETKKKLRDAGKGFLVDIHELNQSGYAGIKSTGEIVDRRIFTDAVPIQKNTMMGIPEPKKLKPV